MAVVIVAIIMVVEVFCGVAVAVFLERAQNRWTDFVHERVFVHGAGFARFEARDETRCIEASLKL